MLAFFKAPFAVTALALLLTVPGQSAVITLNFTGTVTGVADAQNHFGGAISNGESYTGWVKYDTSAYLANSFLLGSTPTVDYEINNLASTLPVMMSFQVGSNSFTATVATGHADEIEVRTEMSCWSAIPSSPVRIRVSRTPSSRFWGGTLRQTARRYRESRNSPPRRVTGPWSCSTARTRATIPTST